MADIFSPTFSVAFKLKKWLVKALAFFHLPILQTSSEVKPRLLYMATPAPLVECAFHTEVSTPNVSKVLLVKLPMVLAFNGTKGGLKEMNTDVPGAAILAVKETYFFNNVHGHKAGMSGIVTKASH